RSTSRAEPAAPPPPPAPRATTTPATTPPCSARPPPSPRSSWAKPGCSGRAAPTPSSPSSASPPWRSRTSSSWARRRPTRTLFFPARIIFPSLAAFSTLTPAVFWFPVLTDSPIYPGVSTDWSDPVPVPYHDDTQFDRDHSSFGVFAQDEWRVGRELTLTYGLRYDLEQYPEFFVNKRDSNNVQPRLGFAYAFSPRSVLRGGV